jgi:hypothetical protein
VQLVLQSKHKAMVVACLTSTPRKEALETKSKEIKELQAAGSEAKNEGHIWRHGRNVAPVGKWFIPVKSHDLQITNSIYSVS